MALLGQSAFLKALGWALLNSIWQMAILWLVYLVLSASLRKQLTAHIKHSLSILLLGIGSLWFAFTLVLKYFDYSEAPVLVLAEEGTQQTFAGALMLSLRNLEALLPYLSSGYLVAVVFLFFRLISQYRYTQHVTTTAVHKLQPQLRMYVQQIAARMGIKKEIRVWLSEIIDTPMTIGFWKPVILMPIASVNGLNTQQVEAILLHELAHIRRNDYLVNLMVATIDVILFFNPFSRLFTRTIRRERENSCDDLVLQFEYNPHAYASALLAIEKKRVMKVSLGMAATGKNNRMLLDRVKRILNQPVTSSYGNRLFGYLFAAFLLAFIAWSNPGNVLVRKIMNADTNVAASTENNDAVFVSNPVAEVKQQEKEQKPRAALALKLKPDEALTQEEEQEVLYDLATQVAFEAAEYIPTAITAMQVAAEEMRDFSISEQLTIEKPMVATTITTPYVPSTSFSYYFQDSTKPGLVIPTAEEKAANESLRKALKALEEVDWATIEKQLKDAGDKIDIRKLQQELKKSLKSVDWEKVNAETKLEQLQMDSKVRQDIYLRELTAAKKNAQMAEHYQNLQKKILQDQINCQQEQLKKEAELKNHLQKKSKTTTTAPVKKIVVI
jgi:beta-lactamase regulating signal transducer with metallopeptidase domain/flavin-binding protein dodecin